MGEMPPFHRHPRQTSIMRKMNIRRSIDNWLDAIYKTWVRANDVVGKESHDSTNTDMLAATGEKSAQRAQWHHWGACLPQDGRLMQAEKTQSADWQPECHREKALVADLWQKQHLIWIYKWKKTCSHRHDFTAKLLAVANIKAIDLKRHAELEFRCDQSSNWDSKILRRE